LLLKKYGWPLIFVQRYMYGMRTVIPMAIGITKYSARDFAIINLVSAFFWASLTIIPAYYFGEQLLALLAWIKEHFYLAIPFALTIFLSITYIFRKIEKNLLEKRHERRTV
jgi:membrane protein DedA with SNARE-associated domain